jgi:hypothetical protein
MVCYQCNTDCGLGVVVLLWWVFWARVLLRAKLRRRKQLSAFGDSSPRVPLGMWNTALNVRRGEATRKDK